MAATFTSFTLEDIQKFLKRSFFALHPKQGASRGEFYFDLNLSDRKIFIRVWTSVSPNGHAVGVGSDAIRVTLLTSKGVPMKGAEKIVKRTQNWKSNLQDRIEGLIELYESKAEYWKMHQEKRDSEKEQKAPPSWAEDVEDDNEDQEDHMGPKEHMGSFAKYDDQYVASIPGRARSGDTAILVKRDGSKVTVKLIEQVGSKGQCGYWSFSQVSRSRYATVEEDDLNDFS